jgi:hypothetical protein
MQFDLRDANEARVYAVGDEESKRKETLRQRYHEISVPTGSQTFRIQEVQRIQVDMQSGK